MPPWFVLCDPVADPGFWKGGGGQEEGEGVSCRSECGCSRNAAALDRAKPELPRGFRGHAPPENFENSTVKICIFTHFEGLDSLASWRQHASFLYPNCGISDVAYAHAYGKPDHSFYTRAHDCALLSIEKKNWGSPERGGPWPLWPPPPPWIRHCDLQIFSG